MRPKGLWEVMLCRSASLTLIIQFSIHVEGHCEYLGKLEGKMEMKQRSILMKGKSY